MRPTRAATLAGLVLVAVAAPAAAYALVDNDASNGSSQAAAHNGKDKDKDKAKGQDKSEKSGRGDEASAAGRAHAKAMQAWAKCVAEAASGPKTGQRTGPPKEACGEKPMGPGKARHQADGDKHDRKLPKKDNGHRR